MEPFVMNERLLAIHKILLCPGECPPIEEIDSWEVKALKGIIHIWHIEARELKKAEKEISNLQAHTLEHMKLIGDLQIENEHLSGLLKEARAAIEMLIEDLKAQREYSTRQLTGLTAIKIGTDVIKKIGEGK